MKFDDTTSEYWSQTFKDLELSGAVLANKEFESCTFASCDFSEATFDHCKFVDCEFSQCNLSVADLGYSRFLDVTFHESKLVGINWTRGAWPSMGLNSPLQFHKSILNDCSFFGLAMRELIMEDCKVHQADFREGDFSRAKFSYTDFTGSLFGKTNLTEADFSEATAYDIDVYQNTLTGAKFTRYEAVRLLESLGLELVD